MMLTPVAAFKALVDGVTSWDIPQNLLPSELLLIGEAAFPVMVNDKGQVLIAASSYGQGRLVIVSHEGYLTDPGSARFLLNAVRWLCPSPWAPIRVHPSLASLVNILQDCGVKAHIGTEPGDPLGAYCVNAYDDTMTENLIQFVKHGGGLLIGGQAWYWASRHGRDKVLSRFPGNQVTSVAGVYFTDAYGETGHFKVSKEMPKIPLQVRCGEDLSKDQQQLLEGISELNINGERLFSHVLVHGALAFPLGLDNSLGCFLAAARYGHGRVVLSGHGGFLLDPRNHPFVVNALHWLVGHQKGKIGLSSEMLNLGPLLSNNNLEWSSTNLMTSDLSVFCCTSLDNLDVKKVEEFIAEGGGLLTGSQAWWWASHHPNHNYMSQYSANKFLTRFGLGISDEIISAGCFPVPKPGAMNYHIRGALSQFQSMLHNKGRSMDKNWLEKLIKDCSHFFLIPHEGIPIYESVHKTILKIVQQNGLPLVNKENPISKGSNQAVLISLAKDLAKSGIDCSLLLRGQTHSFLGPTKSPITIEISPDNNNSWVSTGLYLPEGQIAEITLPDAAVTAGLRVQIGCHVDNISGAETYHRPPEVTHSYRLDRTKKSISWLWGGLLYIIVPSYKRLSPVSLTISGAVSAPYFKLGQTSQEEWKRCIQENPVPWGELATDNIILTVPTANLRALEDPEPLLCLWDEVMQAVARLAAGPFPFCRPERIVADVQISAGWMHSGYPIMCHLQSVPEFLNKETIRSTGIWGLMHEVGHNQQQPGWNFPPYTAEATCNLWSVYVHEMVLGISRTQVHPDLCPPEREKRIKTYLDKGAPLQDWNVWTALETYLQLQEAFGWEPYIQLFAEYQTLSNLPKDNTNKMNLWVKKFSEKVQKNLVPFFEAWGWPIQKKVADTLASLPEWQENPMKRYIPFRGK
ncbi:TRPM8 channel-associated factor 2-like [Tamandua tetradactyla]|uniref:TRPM8 channel-associated factor 2-like n=1 Tax=Tamandua tetradactyla TaxID=48850 RepID=UPI004053B2AC